MERRTGPCSHTVLAAVLSFVWALGCLHLVEMQFQSGLRETLYANNMDFAKVLPSMIIPGWNLIISAVYIFLGIELLRGHEDAHSWASSTNILNTLLVIGWTIFGGLAKAWWVLIPIQIAIVWAVYHATKYATEPVESSAVETPRVEPSVDPSEAAAEQEANAKKREQNLKILLLLVILGILIAGIFLEP